MIKLQQKKISDVFFKEIVPVLKSMQEDGYPVKLQPDWIYVGDGNVPSRISICDSCFAYTLHLKELLRELFPDAGITVCNNKLETISDWMDLNDLFIFSCS